MSFNRNSIREYDDDSRDDEDIVYDVDEGMTPEYFNSHSEEIIHKIKLERDIYSKLLNEILDNSRSTKEKLDMYYDNLQWYHSIVQTSVIIVSTGSTFLQSILDKDNFESALSLTTICVSTYSGLILSLAKFFKFEKISSIDFEKINLLSSLFSIAFLAKTIN